MGKRWKLDDLEKLRRLYPNTSWQGLLTAFPGRTRHSIHARAVTLDIKRLCNSSTQWTKGEKEILRRLYPNSSWDVLKVSLPGHTPTAIGHMASELGIKRALSGSSKYLVIRSLRAQRRAQGLSQEKLAKRIGIDRNHLSKWESGNMLPRLRGLFDWCDALGVKLTIVDKAERKVCDSKGRSIS